MHGRWSVPGATIDLPSEAMEETVEQSSLLCINCYGTTSECLPPPLAGSVTIQAKTTLHCSPDSSMSEAKTCEWFFNVRTYALTNPTDFLPVQYLLYIGQELLSTIKYVESVTYLFVTGWVIRSLLLHTTEYLYLYENIFCWTSSIVQYQFNFYRLLFFL